jgi:transcriptional regulator with XRE-family HTH domain
MADIPAQLGQELLRMRQRRGISQFDLAVAMGWKGTNPVIQIEKGRRLPKPETIERLGEALGLSYLEVHYLNGLAGYVPPTRLPPADHIIRTLDAIADRLAQIPLPAAVMDYQFRCWVFNPAGLLFTGGDLAMGWEMLKRPLDVLQIIFDSRLAIRGSIADLANTEKEFVFTYKATNGFRQHEPFYRSLPERMADYLLPEDYDAFAQVWRMVDLNTVESVGALQVADFYARQEQGDIQLNFPEGVVACHLRRESILHLGDLFQVMTFLPVDSPTRPGNRALAESLFQRYAAGQMESLKVWDVVDMATLV